MYLPVFFPPLPDFCFSDSFTGFSSAICSLDAGNGQDFGFPGGSDGKESASNEGDLGSSPGLGRSPGEENGYPLQYGCLENSTDRGAWWTTVHGVAKLDTTE